MRKLLFLLLPLAFISCSSLKPTETAMQILLKFINTIEVPFNQEFKTRVGGLPVLIMMLKRFVLFYL
jgi:hypothetical protein